MAGAAVEVASDGEVLRVTEEVLSRSEYAGRMRDDAAWLAFFDRLREALAWMDGLAVTSPALFWTLLGGLFLVALLLLAHIGFSLRAALRAPEPEDPARLGEPRRDPLGEAARLAEAGRYLEASRLVHRACLEVLVGSERLRLDRGDAGAALRRALSDASLASGDRDAYRHLFDQLERAVFREGAGDRALYDAWRDLHSRLAVGWGTS